MSFTIYDLSFLCGSTTISFPFFDYVDKMSLLCKYLKNGLFNLTHITIKMKTKFLLAALLCLMHCVAGFAQKALYIPNEWKNFNSRDTLLYAEVDTERKYTWSKTRSKESENFICYWDKYYTKEPTQLSSSDFYHVDIDDLLQKAEFFYSLNVGKLAFCDEATSKVKRYKMMILMNHTTTWTAYGGGYDFVIGALWLNPATCKPVGHTLAHEIGHSFQYMCYSDLGGHTGFHDAIGSGSTFWEQTAQWQAAQAYPNEKFSQSWFIFPYTANYAMTHEWMRYQSYWWHYYLAEKYGVDIIGKIWRHPMSAASDANQVLMDLMGYDVSSLYKEYFDYAMKMATLDIDFDNIRSESVAFTDSYIYNYVSLGGTKFQVAYSSCPQSTGFNVIPLNVPKAGTTIRTEFVSLKNAAPLADGDPAVYFNGDSRYVALGKTTYNSVSDYRKRGFRLGYVALLNDGTRVYQSEDSVYCTGSSGLRTYACTTEFTVPENVQSLYMVVVPAPTAYIQHRWDDNITNDDQWPYTVEFTGTSIKGAPDISADRDICDATLTYQLTLPKSTSAYTSVLVTIDDVAASLVGTAIQASASEIDNRLVEWASKGPQDGEMMFYALTPAEKIANAGATANGYGHWFSEGGLRTTYASGYLYSEFSPSALAFYVGQYPGKLTVGKTYKIGQAIKYKKGDKEAIVRFIFNVTCTSSSSAGSCELISMRLFTPGDLDGDGTVSHSDLTALLNIYLGGDGYDKRTCDLDGDGKLTLADVTKMIETYFHK